MAAQLRIREGIIDRLKETRQIPTDQVFAQMVGVDRGTLTRVKEGSQPSGAFMAGFVLAFGLGLGEAFEVVEERLR